MTKRLIPEAVRANVLARDGYRCTEPGCTKKTGLHIHHLVPEKLGGLEVPENLRTLCEECHLVQHIEFQAYYPSSIPILWRMSAQMNRWLKNFRRYSWAGRLYYRPFLRLLTGQSKFRPGQQVAVEAAVSGRDVLFVAPTGSGKSLCYQLPGLLADKPSLVISPLKALMRDQVQELGRKRIPATFLNSDVGWQDKAARHDLIRSGVFTFVMVAPEHLFQPELKVDKPVLVNYGFLVIDEAHCVDKWGRKFRPAYERLRELRRHLGNPPTIALTASASRSTQKKIIKSLELDDPVVEVTGFDRPEISLTVTKLKGGKVSEDAARFQAIEALLDRPVPQGFWFRLRRLFATPFNSSTPTFKKTRKHPVAGKTIIFVPTINVGKRVARYFYDLGYDVDLYHSRRSKDDKTEIHNRFSGKSRYELDLLVTTSAFGMGIDIPNIRQAVHWSIPANIEEYYQQIGRAGRDGGHSRATLLYVKGDEGLVRYLNQVSLSQHARSKADQERLEKIEEKEIGDMLGYVNSRNKWKYLLKYFGARNR